MLGGYFKHTVYNAKHDANSTQAATTATDATMQDPLVQQACLLCERLLVFPCTSHQCLTTGQTHKLCIVRAAQTALAMLAMLVLLLLRSKHANKAQHANMVS